MRRYSAIVLYAVSVLPCLEFISLEKRQLVALLQLYFGVIWLLVLYTSSSCYHGSVEVYNYAISWPYALAYAVAFSLYIKYQSSPLGVVKPSNRCVGMILTQRFFIDTYIVFYWRQVRYCFVLSIRLSVCSSVLVCVFLSIRPNLVWDISLKV